MPAKPLTNTVETGLRIGPAYPWLAPLAGHTDLVFRTLCREQGAAVACTEMVSAKGLIYGEQSRKGQNATKKLLQTNMQDAPLVVQLFGEEPDFLGQAVALLRSWGFDWFDLNLGCSVPKVTKTGAGAALSRNIQKTLACAKAMIQAADPAYMPTDMPVDVPADMPKNVPENEPTAQNELVSVCVPAGRVGFKLRLGWSREEENYLELARGLVQSGAAWLTLHPRYARQGFTGCADYAAFEKLSQVVNIPVIASGDIFDAETALRLVRQRRVSGVMFARGALHNPAIFKDYLRMLEKNLENNGNRVDDSNAVAQQGEFKNQSALKKLILRHAELSQNQESSLFKMRGSVARYVKDLPGSKALRINISRCASWAEFYQLVEDFFGGYNADN